MSLLLLSLFAGCGTDTIDIVFGQDPAKSVTPPDTAADTGADTDLDVDADGDGYTPGDNDCDDADATVNPDAEEVADGVDNDCVGGDAPC